MNFRMNEEQLTKTFARISAKHGQQVVGDLRLNMFLIATGPYHQDFPIQYNNKQTGRLSIDIRVSQIFETSVRSLGTDVSLFKDVPGNEYHYTLRTISTTFKDKESSPSHSELDEIKPTEYDLKKKQTKSITDIQLHKICWTQQKSKSKGTSLPLIKSTVLGNQLQSATLQFLMWMVNAQTKTEKFMMQHKQGMALCGECYVSFNKLQQATPRMQIINNVKTDIFQTVATEKLWYHGKHIGEVSLKLQVHIPHHLNQTIVFVRTENGIQTTSPVFQLGGIAGSKTECEDLKQLQTIKKKIQEGIHKLNEHADKPAHVRDMKETIHFDLVRMLPMLEKSSKQSVLIYSYNNQNEMLRGQVTLLEIGFQLLENAESEMGLEELGWKCLMGVMKRGQVTLRHMGFKPEEKQSITEGRLSDYLKEKLEISIRFQTFQYRILKMVLHFLNKKALQEYERMFVDLFCAYSFFRIPEFRHRILEIIKKPGDPHIDEWRGTEYSLQDDQQPAANRFNKDQDTFSLLFDWNNNFYSVIGEDDKAKSNLNDLNDILKSEPWEHRLEKRGVAFFFFLSYWIRYVETIAVISDNVKWQNLPGYTQLLRAFLCEMKLRPITQYPDNMCQTMARLLLNEKLLNILVMILLNKTNLYDSPTMLKTLELMNKFFQEISRRKKAIPTTFNHSMFFGTMKDIVSCDHSYTIAKCLLLYYDHYNLFNSEIRHAFNMFLLSKAFFKLFLSWSLNVRAVMQHLMVFRMNLQANLKSQDKQQYDMSEEIKRRYTLLINIIENARIKKEEDQNRKFGFNYEKDLFKRMRKKLADKKKMGYEDYQIRQARQIDMTQFSIKELARPPTQRYKSEVGGMKVNYNKPKISYDNVRINKLQSSTFEKPEEELRLRRVTSIFSDGISIKFILNLQLFILQPKYLS